MDSAIRNPGKTIPSLYLLADVNVSLNAPGVMHAMSANANDMTMMTNHGGHSFEQTKQPVIMKYNRDNLAANGPGG